MKVATLAVGMRGAGKSTYCQKVKAQHPEIFLFDRDEYYRQHFGHFTFDPYTGEGTYAAKCFWEYIQKTVTENDGKFLIDCWTGWANERRSMIAQLYSFGAERVNCWLFDPPLEQITCWFTKRELKPGSFENEQSLASRCRWDYELFHKNLDNIIFPDDSYVEPNSELDPKQDWRRFHFDQITSIDPTQLVFADMPLI